jgi:MGT family glycosyltransferase
MASIVFLFDVEEGHILPSFGLARSLQRRGHQIYYFSILDNENFIRDQGFEFFPVFSGIYPKGFAQQYKKYKETEEKPAIEHFHLNLVIDGALDPVLVALEPDILVVSSLLPLEALILHYRLNIKPVMFAPFFRESPGSISIDCVDAIMRLNSEQLVKLERMLQDIGRTFTSLAQVVDPMKSFHELISCPIEFAAEDEIRSQSISYIQACIREGNAEQKRELDVILPKDKRVIFASLGSQPNLYGISEIFFDSMIAIMQQPEMEGHHLVMAVGAGFAAGYKRRLPDNILMRAWVDQIEILKRASIAVIHGGLGTIKECIFFGVPMIVVPQVYDQPKNARRVADRRLGISISNQDVTEDHLLKSILHVQQSHDIQMNVRNLQKVFQDYEAREVGADVVEQLLVRVA